MSDPDVLRQAARILRRRSKRPGSLVLRVVCTMLDSVAEAIEERPKMTTEHPSQIPACLTCGHPRFRREGHAEWCASWEAKSQADKNEAAIQLAVETGVSEIGETHRAALRRARQRTGLP